MGRRMAELVLSEAERTELKLLSSRRKTAQALAMRARIVLECAQGFENQEVAARLRVAKGTVGKWRRRFAERRMDGLHDEARSGAPRSIDDNRIEAAIVKTLESLPENATHVLTGLLSEPVDIGLYVVPIEAGCWTSSFCLINASPRARSVLAFPLSNVQQFDPYGSPYQ